ncbi:MAG: hypothetical protein ACWGMZ_06430, partial [Thermoguttaceae bacterium]
LLRRSSAFTNCFTLLALRQAVAHVGDKCGSEHPSNLSHQGWTGKWRTAWEFRGKCVDTNIR